MTGLVLPTGAHALPQLRPQLEEARRLVRWGATLALVALLPAGAWLAFAPLASAVMAPAHVKVDLDRKPIQHAEGGIVREVKVRDGQRVRQGEPLLVLGDVGVDADVNRLKYRVQAERAGVVRHEAELSGATSLAFPADLEVAAGSDSRLAEQLVKERTLFSTRRDGVLEQASLLRSQRQKVAQEITSLQAQIEQVQQSLAHQRADLEKNRRLVQEGFIADAKLLQLQAAAADYAARLEERRSELARAGQRMVEIELRLKSLASDYRQQASDQLKVASVRLSELQQELRKSTDASQRQVIVAPAAGEVMNLRFSSAGAVVSPRETIADIVPADPRLVVEAQIRPEDVSRVRQGQAAHVRFTSFNALTTPMVGGKVFYISADRLVERVSQQPYYVVLVEVDPASLQDAGALALQAGMPAEVFIDGESRTALQYLMEPITLVLQRAGRER